MDYRLEILKLNGAKARHENQSAYVKLCTASLLYGLALIAGWLAPKRNQSEARRLSELATDKRTEADKKFEATKAAMTSIHNSTEEYIHQKITENNE